MQPSRRHCLYASVGLLSVLAFAPLASRASAETLTITSTPAGAMLEINGLRAGTTPYKTDYPGGYFHKTHTAFGSRLEHAMVLKVSMDGYLSQQVTLTEGPFEWVAVTGRHRGNYFLLKSNEFHIKLDPISYGTGRPVETIGRDGPLRPPPAAAFQEDRRPDDAQPAIVKVESDPSGADIYVDGNFAGQTPSTLRLASGLHRIELKSQGRKAWQRELDVMKDSQLTLHPSLEPLP